MGCGANGISIPLMMVVDNFDNDCIRDFFPNIAPIGIDWDGVCFGGYDEAVGLVEVKSPLAFAIGA